MTDKETGIITDLDNNDLINLLGEIRDEQRLANDLKLQELSLNKTTSETLVAFTLMLNDYSILGLNKTIQQDVMDKIRNSEGKLDEFNISGVVNQALERILGLNNIAIIKDLDPVDWEIGVNYTIGMQIKYKNKVYKVVTPHTSQENWQPDNAHTLFTLIATEQDITDVEDGKCPEFAQPQANTTYNIDDCVVFEGKTYISKINSNAWAPNVYPAGWELQSGK